MTFTDEGKMMSIQSFFAADDFTGEQCVLLSDHIASHAYEEAKERELFELNHEVPDGVYFSKEKNEYRSMNMRGFEILACEDLTPKLKGWQACAKSRARSSE